MEPFILVHALPLHQESWRLNTDGCFDSDV